MTDCPERETEEAIALRKSIGQIEDAYDILIIRQEDVTTKTDWRWKCKELALAAVNILPAGRERALALTKIEEALLWGHRAIDRGPVK